jgi:TubC N-terminal docking domain
MTAAALVESLRARGVHLRVVGDRIRYRPASALTPADLEALKERKVEILRLLAQPAPALTLDLVTVREVLGGRPDPHDLGILRLDVLAAVRQLEIEIASGAIWPGVRLIRGRPIAAWLSLDDLARIMQGVR